MTELTRGWRTKRVDGAECVDADTPASLLRVSLALECRRNTDFHLSPSASIPDTVATEHTRPFPKIKRRKQRKNTRAKDGSLRERLDT